MGVRLSAIPKPVKLSDIPKPVRLSEIPKPEAAPESGGLLSAGLDIAGQYLKNKLLNSPEADLSQKIQGGLEKVLPTIQSPVIAPGPFGIPMNLQPAANVGTGLIKAAVDLPGQIAFAKKSIADPYATAQEVVTPAAKFAAGLKVATEGNKSQVARDLLNEGAVNPLGVAMPFMMAAGAGKGISNLFKPKAAPVVEPPIVPRETVEPVTAPSLADAVKPMENVSPKITTSEATKPNLLQSNLKQSLPEKDLREILAMSDQYDRPREPYVPEFEKYANKLKNEGHEYIDAYHITDANKESLLEKGVLGSSSDYIGKTGTGRERPNSSYVFLDPDDIKIGMPGITGIKNGNPNIIHLQIPIEEIKNFHWDSNFNVTFGTRSSIRIQGDIPTSWIKDINGESAPPPVVEAPRLQESPLNVPEQIEGKAPTKISISTALGLKGRKSGIPPRTAIEDALFGIPRKKRTPQELAAAGRKMVVENRLWLGQKVSKKALAEFPDLAEKYKEPAEPAPAKLAKEPLPSRLSSESGQAINPFVEASEKLSEVIKKFETPPELKAGIAEAKESMIAHDENIRSAEFLRHKFAKTVNDVVPNKERQMLMIHAYENKMKGKYWEQLSPLEQKITEWAGMEKAKLQDFIKKNDVLELMQNEDINHIYHHWINPKTGQPFEPMYGKFSKGLPQAKQRVIPTYEAGIKSGMKPATTNLGELVGIEIESVARAHNARQLFKELHNIELMPFDEGPQLLTKRGKSRPTRMIESWSDLKENGQTEGYKYYNNQFLDKAITYKTPSGVVKQIKGAVGIKDELYPFVRAYIESPNYSKLENLNFATKSLRLGGSLFHVVSLGAQELANFRIPFKNIPRGLKSIKDLGPEVQALHKAGLDVFKGYEDLGYQNKFFNAEGWVGKLGNAALKPIELLRDFTFKVVQPGMKTSFAVDEFNKFIKKGMPEADAARWAVKQADGHFSGEHYKRSLLESSELMAKLYFSPEARRVWQATLLSPTWQREHILVAKNVAKSFLPGGDMPKPVKASFRKYALGAAMIIGAADMLNYINSYRMDGEGKHLWQNPPTKGFAVRANWDEPAYTETDKDGHVRHVAGGKAYIRPLKSVFEVAEWFADPIEKLSGKISPIVSTTMRQIVPDRYRAPYEGWGDMPRRAGDIAKDMIVPMGLAPIKSVYEGKRELPAALLPFFGVPTSKVKDEASKPFKLHLKPIVKMPK